MTSSAAERGAGEELRRRLRAARLMLLFTPDLAHGDPLGALAACAPHVDAVQVRVKPVGSGATAQARATIDWTRRVLALLGRGPCAPLVLVDDRVDVAALLAPEGCAGCHVGTLDLPATEARALLGPVPLLGLSTHSPADVARAAALDVDYLGFGPVHATPTRGYGAGLGAEAAWVAASAALVPVFPIGGIDAANAVELEPVGRAAVGAAILASRDPAGAARAIRAALGEGEAPAE